MTNYRGALLSALLAGAMGFGGCAGGYVGAVPVDAWTPATSTPAPVQPPNMTASQIAAWDVYRVETGDSGGCWEDFTSSFRGWSKDGKGLPKGVDTIFTDDGGKYGAYVVLDPYVPGICGEEV